MSNVFVSKKIYLVRSMTDDVVTDDIINNIAVRAKTIKGKRLKLKINEAGIKLSRVRLLQESHTKFFPLKTVQTVMQIAEYPKCVMFILSDPEKKYKIIALRCESETEAAKLTSVFSEIQNQVQSENIELRKRENGNWTLRGKTDHNSNRLVNEIFIEHKQFNGDLRVVKTNGEVTQVPVIDASEGYKNRGQGEDVARRQDGGEVKRRTDKDSDSDSDDYVIETEVATGERLPVSIQENRIKHEMRNTTSVDHSSVRDTSTTGWVSGKSQNHSQTSALPSRPVVYRTTSSNLALPQPVVYGTTSRHVAQPHHVYGTTSGYVATNEPIVYTATSARTVTPQADGYSISSRSYKSATPVVVNAASAGYFTNPWASRQQSRNSPLVPFRVDTDPSAVKFDQQSLMSNTSRLSRFSRLRSSEMSIPTTVERSIEVVYPRHLVVLRPSRGHIVSNKPRPASYHAPELRVYQEDEREDGIIF